ALICWTQGHGIDWDWFQDLLRRREYGMLNRDLLEAARAIRDHHTQQHRDLEEEYEYDHASVKDRSEKYESAKSSAREAMYEIMREYIGRQGWFRPERNVTTKGANV